MAGKEKDKEKKDEKLEFTRKPCPNEFENRATFPDPKAGEPLELKRERGFPCKYCQKRGTTVRQTWDLRSSLGEIRRRRKCLECGQTFLTREILAGRGVTGEPEDEEF